MHTLLAVGGIMTLMASFPASFLTTKYQTVALAAANCLFDGSSVVFLGLYSIKSHFSASRQHLLCALTVVATALYAVLIALWHVSEHAPGKNGTTKDEARLTASSSCSEAHQVSNKSEPNDVPDVVDCETASSRHSLHPQKSDARPDKFVDVPIRKHIRTFEFFFIVVFAAVQELRAMVYIGTTNILLENYGDEQHDHLYTTIYSIVLPLIFVFVPAMDHVVEKRGLTTALRSINVLGLGYNLLALVPNLNVQCVTFFLFTGFRVFLCTVLSVFTAKIFGFQNMGTLMGLIYTIGAVMNLLEYPAVLLSNAYFSGELYVV
uniref:Major facilitator superfamily associated domain-containing protein n=1 Tax=Globisporangium ultimum (strain ATCC 200006 / CBS 805.95 / DAOM BR144) TaxID=431595 RepID=K3WGJ9_GLOUD